MFLHYPAETATNVVTVIVLEGDVDPDVVRAALPLLQAAWPLLNVHPERVGRRWWNTTDGTPGIDLEVVEREDDEHWQRVADGIVNRPAPPGLGRFLRVVLLRGQHQPRVELLFVMHHLIADGVGPNAVIAELLSLVDRLASGDDVEAPSLHPLGQTMTELVEARFGRRPRTAALARYLTRSAGAQRKRTTRRRRFPPLDADACRPRVGPATPSGSSSRRSPHGCSRRPSRAPRHDHGCALRRRRARDARRALRAGHPHVPDERHGDGQRGAGSSIHPCPTTCSACTSARSSCGRR